MGHLNFTTSFRSWLVPTPSGHTKVALARVTAGLTMVGLMGLGLGPSVSTLMMSMALLGVPHGITLPLASSLVADGRPEDDLPAVNSYLSAVVQAVTVALSPVLGVTAGVLGYRLSFLILLGPVGFCALTQVVGVPRRRREVRTRPGGRSRA